MRPAMVLEDARAVGVVRGLTDKDEALLDESGDSVVGGEEEEADGEDEEAEVVGDALEVILGVLEHGGHHEAHDGENPPVGKERARGSVDVGEVSAHEDPYLGGVGVFGGEVVLAVGRHGRGWVIRGKIVVLSLTV
ncbi:pentatricopeptide repeat (PPR-like) superfamily protein [Actinidia rufa]|uniref:Pentatricopeptide repeat (PPR-like) superfamily protein n=1 Tax=Actinidia rufa TaxID=165716 RepID=A0A7J0H711_9ERIC|nr:pentatricopeptide repeat (PPR-like) superfamily protein [Actinidia rufa]